MTDRTRDPVNQSLVDVRDRRGVARLGLMTNQVWLDDPKRLVFTLARYKFVAKMLAGRDRVLEVGCGDGFGARIVRQEVGHLLATDYDPLFIRDAQGVLIVGMPSLESQAHASAASRAGHVNCKTGGALRSVMERHFHNVFMFSMNDEMVHAGFMPMDHYLFALCVGKR